MNCELMYLQRHCHWDGNCEHDCAYKGRPHERHGDHWNHPTGESCAVCAPPGPDEPQAGDAVVFNDDGEQLKCGVLRSIPVIVADRGKSDWFYTIELADGGTRRILASSFYADAFRAPSIEVAQAAAAAYNEARAR